MIAVQNNFIITSAGSATQGTFPPTCDACDALPPVVGALALPDFVSPHGSNSDSTAPLFGTMLSDSIRDAPRGVGPGNSANRDAAARLRGSRLRRVPSRPQDVRRDRVTSRTLKIGEAVFGSLTSGVRCSSLIDWPVYPRLRRTMRADSRSRNLARRTTTSRPVRNRPHGRNPRRREHEGAVDLRG